MLKQIKQTLKSIEEEEWIPRKEILRAQHILDTGNHAVLSWGKEKITVLIENGNDEDWVEIIADDEENLLPKVNGSLSDWEACSLVALYVIENELKGEPLPEGIKYTRLGMIKRVLHERLERADKAQYKVQLSKNIFGEHTLINEKGKAYQITLRDFENKTGYINNVDWKTNKLGTTKHIMYLFDYLKRNPAKMRKMDRSYPFIEIYTDPLNDYKITWYYPDKLQPEERRVLKAHFGEQNFIEDSQIPSFFPFIRKCREMDRIKIREEVYEKVETFFEQKELEQLEKNTVLDFSAIKATLYPYQKEGVAFSVFKKGTIIADEMGLGKTLQAIVTATIKKEVFDFRKTLVICPSSVKRQWRDEILRFSDEKAVVVEGFPEERKDIYLNDPSFFHIINYETVLRDLPFINKAGYDFVILDEAQKIKNYETKTANAVKSIHKRHGLVITGTPLENKLLDLYSIVQFLDPYFLAPQWEFSYQHCIFDAHSKNKICGYYNLQNLKSRMASILIRREKQEVFDQLPNVVQQDVFVQLSDEQAGLHSSFGRGIASILAKKFKTPYDWQKLMLLLTNMRMVCDSTYLIDKETHFSPKLIELRDILVEKLDIKSKHRKVLIFSEWVTMLHLIGDMLREEEITFTLLTGKVPVKKRGALIKEFEGNPDCNVFLSSETGGAGLNLQMADTVINFELPWNPAKKNQRIGRIDRIGQKKQKLHVFNLLSLGSIEIKIATGLLLKQNLFDGVLNSGNITDEVDFSEKGKSQFIRQLEEMMDGNGFSKTDDDGADVDMEDQEEVALQEITSSENQPESISENKSSQTKSTDPISNEEKETDFSQMEEVMAKGMDFLTGIYKMSTGKDMNTQGKPKVKVNKETGEVSITFKMNL